MIHYVDNRLVFIDTETGGTDPHKHSLLSIGIVVWDKTLGIIAEKEYFVKNTRYYVTKEAQKINKFDRKMHNAVAKEPKEIINGLSAVNKGYFHVGANLSLYSFKGCVSLGFCYSLAIDHGYIRRVAV